MVFLLSVVEEVGVCRSYLPEPSHWPWQCYITLVQAEFLSGKVGGVAGVRALRCQALTRNLARGSKPIEDIPYQGMNAKVLPKGRS